MLSLVTGAAGFIGSHLVEALAREGHAVRALVRYRSDLSIGHLEALDDELARRVEIVRGDLRDPACPRRLMDDVSVIFHLGALGSVPYSLDNVRTFAEVNALGTAHMLEACLERSVPRFVLMSTSEVYGTAQTETIAETHPLVAQSPYAASKIAAEKLVESAHYAHGLATTIVRGFNVYGPRQSARAVIPAVIEQGLAGEEIALGNLDPVRDFNFVADTVDAIIRLARAPEAVGEVVNVGTGRATSIGELVDLIADALDSPLRVRTDPARVRGGKCEVRRLVADAGRCRALTGWAPSVSLEEGLRRVVASMRGAPARARGYVV